MHEIFDEWLSTTALSEKYNLPHYLVHGLAKRAAKNGLESAVKRQGNEYIINYLGFEKWARKRVHKSTWGSTINLIRIRIAQVQENSNEKFIAIPEDDIVHEVKKENDIEFDQIKFFFDKNPYILQIHCEKRKLVRYLAYLKEHTGIHTGFQAAALEYIEKCEKHVNTLQENLAESIFYSISEPGKKVDCDIHVILSYAKPILSSDEFYEAARILRKITPKDC